MAGHLIVFEGVEGCGKSTQLERLYHWLLCPQTWQMLAHEGGVPDFSVEVLVTREPGGTELGQLLRGILLGQSGYRIGSEIQAQTELLLYAADRAQHVSEVLVPGLRKGEIVLCDRYTDSTMAYQGYGRGLDRGLIDQLNAIATQGLQSDLTLWLDLDVDIGLARTQKRGVTDRIEQSTLSFHHRVQQGFQELAKAYPERIVRIDARGTPDEVAARIQVVLLERLKQWYGGKYPA